MNKLEQAARQALGALVRAEAMYGQPNAEIQTALREALAEPELNLNCKSVQKRLATVWGYVKAEQAEQEPVAWIAVADEMPKPHKPVLVRYVITSPVYGGTRSKVIRAQWIPAKTEESNDDDHFEYDEETDTYYIPEGWYELVDNWDEYSSIHVCEGEITHWMRLPEFPNAAPVQQAEQEQFDMDDHPPHRLCECRKCMEYFTPLPDCDAFAASGKPITEQPVSQEYQDHLVNQSFDWAAMAAKHQFIEGYRIGLAEMREKCAKVCETDELCCKCGDECAEAIRAIKFEGDTGFRPVSEMVAEHKQDPKKAAAIEKAKMRKAEQKPVAVVEITYGREPECYVTGNIDDFPEGVFKLYTHPVHTKDLTDDEIATLIQRYTIDGKVMPFALCEAVIAADREKNRG